MSDIVIDPATTPDNVIEAQIDCYSWMWSKSDAQCGGCLVRDRCITAIVTKRIPVFAKDKGGPLEPGDFENTECGSDAESASVLLQISKGKKIHDLLPGQYVTSPTPPATPPEEPTFTQPTPTPAPVKPAKKAAPKKVQAEAPVAVEPKPAKEPKAAKAAKEPKAPAAPSPSAEDEVEDEVMHATPAIEVEPTGASIHASPAEPVVANNKKKVPAVPKATAPTKKKAAKEAAPKKAVKKAPPAVVAPVPEKAPKKKKEAPMKKAAKPATNVVASEKEVASRAKKAKPPKFDKEAFDAAWERERSRSPAVAKVVPGTKLQKSYRGTDIEVEYQKGCVLFEGSKWPTLASVKNAVVGKKDYPRQNGGDGTRAMTDWSVPRFFQLGATKKAAPKDQSLAKKMGWSGPKKKPKVVKKTPPKKVAKKAAKKKG